MKPGEVASALERDEKNGVAGTWVVWDHQRAHRYPAASHTRMMALAQFTVSGKYVPTKHITHKGPMRPEAIAKAIVEDQVERV